MQFGGSKYRHVVGKEFAREMSYPDMRPNKDLTEGTMITSSTEWVAVNWHGAGGQVALFEAQYFGRRQNESPLIHAHSSNVNQMTFSPYDPDLLATASEIGDIRTWKIPQKVEGPLSQPEADLKGHKKRVESLVWHPTASGILLSGSLDRTVRLWNVAAGVEHAVFEGFGDSVCGLAWNYEGSQFVATSKDKNLYLFDPRAGPAPTAKAAGHKGIKASRVTWLGQRNRFLTTGFSQQRERELLLWDAGNLNAPLSRTVIDSSTGVLDPYFDADTDMFFLSGKGDGMIRVFEATEKGPKYFNELSVVNTNSSSLGTCFAPKRACSVMDCEVNRCLKLNNDNVTPVGFFIPRKSKQRFADDLFPDSVGFVPALTSEQWLAGETRPPIKTSMNPEVRQPGAPGQAAAAAPAAAPASAPSPSPSPSPSPAPTASSNPAGLSNQQISGWAEPARPAPAANSAISQFMPSSQPAAASPKAFNVPKNIVRSSKFRHIEGKPLMKREHFEDLQLDQSQAPNSFLKASTKFAAVPWRGTGGQLAILTLDKPGRVINPGFVELGSAVMDFDFSPFDPNSLATGGEDGYVKVWALPDGGLNERLTTPRLTLAGHKRKVVTVDWHPTAAGVLVTSSLDNTVRIWDVEAERCVLVVDGHPDCVQHLAWNYNGSLLVTAGRDRLIRIIDPRQNQVLAEGPGPDGAKGFKVCWLGNTERVAAVGSDKASNRVLQLFDTAALGKPISNVNIDQLSSALTPFFDEGTGVLTLAGKGDSAIKWFEITAEAPYAHYLTQYQAGEPQLGVAVLPKQCVDVRAVEINRYLRLTPSTLVPLQAKVPRTRAEFFQDDLYPPARRMEPALTAAEWFDGKNADPELQSLQPSGMTALSEAPVVAPKLNKYNAPKEEQNYTSRADVNNAWAAMVSKTTAQASEFGAQEKKAANASKYAFDQDSWDDSWD